MASAETSPLNMSEARPSSYLSCVSLARELEVSETTVYEMVRRGVLPQPIKLSSGCVRWCWMDVQRALGSLTGAGAQGTTNDPFLKGVRDATSAS